METVSVDRIAVDDVGIDLPVDRFGHLESQVRVEEFAPAEPGAAEVEEEEPPEVADDAERKGESVDQWEAVFEVEEGQTAAEELPEVVAAQLVQATHRVDVEAAAVARDADEAEGEQGSRGGAPVQAVIEVGGRERAAPEQVGVAAGAQRRRPVLVQLEALAVIGAELLESGGVTAEAPGQQRKGLGELRELGLVGQDIETQRPIDAAAVVAGGGPDSVSAAEGVADLGAGPGEAAELARPERLAGGQ